MNALTRLFVWLLTMVYSYLSAFYLRALEWATGQSELERLLKPEPPVAAAEVASLLLRVEAVLRKSKDPKCEEILRCEDVDRVPDLSSRLSSSKLLVDRLLLLLPLLVSHNSLVARVEALRRSAYDDAADEAELRRLWTDLMPGRPLSARVSAEWTEIGFQGEDPRTDFRGMGMLGLRNLSFFAGDATYQAAARRTLSRSHHPKHWYSWAIVGINLTSLSHEFLVKGLLKRSLYARAVSDAADAAAARCRDEHFHAAFAAIFVAFDELWRRRKMTVMEFNILREEFRARVGGRLRRGALVDEAVEGIE